MSLRVEDLDTPAVTVDLNVVEDNIRRMQAMMASFGLRFRPHIKTHKIPEIAHMQLRAGAVGITCQKLGEAEVMAAAGIQDILIAYNLIGVSKLERLTRLSRIATVTCAVDSAFTAERIAEAASSAGVEIPLVVELDTGDRAGVGDVAAAVELARHIQRLDGVRLRGVMSFPTPPESAPFIAAVVDSFRQNGLSTEIVSGGGTVQAYTAGRIPGLTEHRAGTYVYNDAGLVRREVAAWEQCALRVICTVVSRPVMGRAILDGGSKTFTNDGKAPFGHILEYPDARTYLQSEEHGHVDVSACLTTPEVGERVTIIPNHACGCTNLHDEVYVVRGSQVVGGWQVKARGLIR